MIVFVTGGSASGKSEYAQGLAVRIAESRRILYIATLADRSRESAARIERHRRLRQGGAYDVAECFSPEDLDRAAAAAAGAGYGAVLFDSLDGFTADVMFGAGERSGLPDAEEPGQSGPAGRTAERILNLAGAADGLVIVNDEIYSDGAVYDDATVGYMRYTVETAARLAARADAVIEVVCGIPLLLKGENDELFQIDNNNVFTLHTDTDAVHQLGPE